MSKLFLAVALSMLVSCGQGGLDPNQACGALGLPCTGGGPPAPPGGSGELESYPTRTKGTVDWKFKGYTDASGNPITVSNGVKPNVAPPTVLPIPDQPPCSEIGNVYSYRFSPNVYARLSVTCFGVAGKFLGVGYSTVKVSDPLFNTVQGFKVEGPSGQYVSVLGGPVAKKSGEYYISGVIDNASYAYQVVPDIFEVWEGKFLLPLQPLEVTWQWPWP
jgi:hypothetical protein